MTSDPGVLYVVATPIGNLEDLTFRALRILKEVDLIAAEDTRRTAKLLAHYEIRRPLVSLREHNETRETPKLLARLASGQRIALVSDAGTPAIADPGARLVRAARAAGLKVVPIPGPSAITAALSVSGLSETEFVFMGFPPATGSARRAWLERLAAESRAAVFFEAPHRIARTMTELEQYVGKRPIHVHREITKINEEYVKTPIIKPSGRMPGSKGEFTVIVEASSKESQPKSQDDATVLIGRLTNSSQLNEEEIASVVAAIRGIPEHSARKLIKKYKISVKQRTEPPA
jgi:16S rRNA (cytidine1402-2'-O)-methyltransferase